MKSDNKTIEQFQKMYFDDFGEEISREEAYEKFLRLVNLLRVILLPELQNDQMPPDLTESP